MSKFIGDNLDDDKTVAFIQWKGTDVCMDLNCECGGGGHVDSYFAYIVRCPDCGKEYEMPCYLIPRANQRHDGMEVVQAEA